MKSLDLINNLLKLIQNIFDPNGTHWNSNGDMAMSVFCDGNKKKYNFILDSISLLEDVQLAKANYMKYGLSGPTKYENYGECYLRLYGIYNACYLEKEAIFKLYEILNLLASKKEIEKLEIFKFRKIFASHTINYGYKDKIQSFMLTRMTLPQNRVSGNSMNGENNCDIVDGDLDIQLNEWNLKSADLLVDYCHVIIEKLRKNAKIKMKYFDTIMKRIEEEKTGKVNYVDIWATHKAFKLVTIEDQ